jgi:fluoride exporter
MHLAIAAGGVAGAFARYAAGTFAASWFGLLFPWGTLCVNVAGSCALGFLMRLLPATMVSAAVRAALTVGFCGGFTTFSAFAFDVATLAGERPALAAAYVVSSVVFGVAGVVAGMEAAGLLVRRRAVPARTAVPPREHDTASPKSADATREDLHRTAAGQERERETRGRPAAAPADAEGGS